MRARRIERALRLAAPALAAASLVAAGGSVAASARADEEPCNDGAVGKGIAHGGGPLPCGETVPPADVTETGPIEEPPAETDPAAPAEPAPTVTTTATTPPPPAPAPTRPPAKRSAPAKTPSRAGPPATTARPAPSGGIFDSGTHVGAPYRGTPDLFGGPYVFPVIGQTSFSDTWGAARANVGWHHGVDIFAPLGSPVVAVADGALFSVGWNTIGGNRVWLRDRGGDYFYYAHLSAFSRVAVDGRRVRAGTVIGFVGNTGDAAGTPFHLHFEVHPVSLLSLGYDGAVDPFSYVSSWRRLDHALDGVSAGLGVAGASAARAPGAFLLGYTDISSASGLSPGSLEHTVENAAVAAAPLVESEGHEADTETIATPQSAAGRMARLLDLQAGRYGATVWDHLASCESGGDWGANTGNGFVGGLQFMPQTWQSHGGGAFAPSPNLATREQQIAVAKRVLDNQGWQAWPACSAILGLRAIPNG
jgi:murein DD-endopeptidase MepM/ murein hydrolase activator NlpD